MYWLGELPLRTASITAVGVPTSLKGHYPRNQRADILESKTEDMTGKLKPLLRFANTELERCITKALN